MEDVETRGRDGETGRRGDGERDDLPLPMGEGRGEGSSLGDEQALTLTISHSERGLGVSHRERERTQYTEPRTQDSGPVTNSVPGGLNSEPRTQDSELSNEHSALLSELEEARARGLESHRRALLAENAGKIVPELVMGSTVDEMELSVEVARNAFEAAKAAALAEISARQVPAGNPVRQGPNVESMSPFEKIAYGLKRE